LPSRSTHARRRSRQRSSPSATYLLREFFEGDLKAVADRSPDKMNSFRDLAARDDLVVGYVTLWRAVQLAVQEE
jgi:hypothetical protein